MRVGTVEQALDSWSRIRARFFTLLIGSQFMEIGRGARVCPPFRFSGLHQICLGEGAIVHRDCWIQTTVSDDKEASAKLRIGAGAGIGMGACISAAREIVIGDYVLMGRNVYISDHAHAFEDVAVPIMNQGLNAIAPVSIGRETWLGQNVVVLPGVTIGRHCVIGANSVVNSSIPDLSVAVGAPARVIKRYNREAGAWERVKERSGSTSR